MKIKNILNKICYIFISPNADYNYLRNHKVLPSMIKNTKNLFLNDDSWGLLRIIRIILSFIQFINPFNWICVIIDLCNPIISKFFTDFYVVIKLIIPIIFSKYFIDSNALLNIIIYFIIIETIIYLYTQIICTLKNSRPQSILRTYLMILINYFTIIFSFAYIYYSNNIISNLDTYLKSIYFSLTVGTTTGFGDFYSSTETGYKLICFQLSITVSFLVAFFTYFLPNKNNK